MVLDQYIVPVNIYMQVLRICGGSGKENKPIIFNGGQSDYQDLLNEALKNHENNQQITFARGFRAQGNATIYIPYCLKNYRMLQKAKGKSLEEDYHYLRIFQLPTPSPEHRQSHETLELTKEN